MLLKAALAMLTALAAVVLSPPSALATYPGENGRIYFGGNVVSGGLASGSGDIWSVNPDGTGLVNLTDLPGGPGEGYDPSVSGDGTSVVFGTGSQATAELWTMNADGSNPHRITNDNLLDQQPAISPNGSRIAFSSFRDFPTYVVRDIWTVGFGGDGPAPLIDSTLQDFWPAYAPTGKTLVVAHETGGNNFDIATVPAAGGPFDTVTQVTTASTEELQPSVSPGGSRVAFTVWPDGFPIGSKPDVYSSPIGGGTMQPIAADQSAHESAPAYSPDGRSVVYATDAGNGALVIANADGSGAEPMPLPESAIAFEGLPDWAVKVAPPPDDSPAADTIPPETTITKKPRKRTTRPRVKVRFEASEPGSSFECRLDREQFSDCDSPEKLRHLELRRHRFRVRAIDPSGNADTTPARARFRVLEPPR